MTLATRGSARGLDVTCRVCGHRTEVNVDAWPDDVPMQSFGLRMLVAHCSGEATIAEALPGTTLRLEVNSSAVSSNQTS
jgi:hypothetical protein